MGRLDLTPSPAPCCALIDEDVEKADAELFRLASPRLTSAARSMFPAGNVLEKRPPVSRPRRKALKNRFSVPCYFLLIAAALTSGCATLPPDECSRFDQTRKSTDYDTAYVYSKAETKRAEQSFARRSGRSTAIASWYTLRLNRVETRPCEHLYLIKDLYLQRAADAMRLEEQREFYTAQGQLVATKRENVTDQLTKSGYYTASVPLPIPRGAPPGTYRIISRLIATSENGRAQTLATTSAEFRVR